MSVFDKSHITNKNVENQWKAYLHKIRRREHEYYFFCVRMMIYGLSLTFLGVFFLLKLSLDLKLYEGVLEVFYLVTMSIVFSMMVLDTAMFTRKRKDFRDAHGYKKKRTPEAEPMNKL